MHDGHVALEMLPEHGGVVAHRTLQDEVRIVLAMLDALEPIFMNWTLFTDRASKRFNTNVWNPTILKIYL
jgi:hypothetical protein